MADSIRGGCFLPFPSHRSSDGDSAQGAAPPGGASDTKWCDSKVRSSIATSAAADAVEPPGHPAKTLESRNAQSLSPPRAARPGLTLQAKAEIRAFATKVQADWLEGQNDRFDDSDGYAPSSIRYRALQGLTDYVRELADPAKWDGTCRAENLQTLLAELLDPTWVRQTEKISFWNPKHIFSDVQRSVIEGLIRLGEVGEPMMLRLFTAQQGFIRPTGHSVSFSDWREARCQMRVMASAMWDRWNAVPKGHGRLESVFCDLAKPGAPTHGPMLREQMRVCVVRLQTLYAFHSLLQCIRDGLVQSALSKPSPRDLVEAVHGLVLGVRALTLPDHDLNIMSDDTAFRFEDDAALCKAVTDNLMLCIGEALQALSGESGQAEVEGAMAAIAKGCTLGMAQRLEVDRDDAPLEAVDHPSIDGESFWQQAIDRLDGQGVAIAAIRAGMRLADTGMHRSMVSTSGAAAPRATTPSELGILCMLTPDAGAINAPDVALIRACAWNLGDPEAFLKRWAIPDVLDKSFAWLDVVRDSVLRPVEAVAKSLKEPGPGTFALPGAIAPLRGLDEDDDHGPALTTGSSHLPPHQWKPTGEAFNHLLGFYECYVEALATGLDRATAARHLRKEMGIWQSDTFARQWPFTLGLRELESMILEMLGTKLREVEAASPSRAVAGGAIGGDRKSGAVSSPVAVVDTESDRPPRMASGAAGTAGPKAAGADAVDVEALYEALTRTNPRREDLDGALLGATAHAVNSARLGADSPLVGRFTAFVKTYLEHFNRAQVRSLFLGMAQARGGAAMSESDLRDMLAFPFGQPPNSLQRLGMLDGLIVAVGGARMPEELRIMIAAAVPDSNEFGDVAARLRPR